MKRHLSFALVSALLALAIVPASSFAGTSGSTPTVEVTADDTFSIVLTGDTTPDFTGAALEVARDVADYDGGTGYITVIDYLNANAGHNIKWNFTTGTFTYTPSSADETSGGHTDLTMVTSATPGTNEIYFKVSSGDGSGTDDYTAVNANCTGGNVDTRTHAARGGIGVSGAPSAAILSNASACNATTNYAFPALSIVGPLNGFGGGTYTSAARLLLSDGV